MKIENAIKKLSGFAPAQTDGHGRHWATANGYTVSFLQNGGTGTPICFHVVRVGEYPDMGSDYFPGSYWDTLTAAIKTATRYAVQDVTR